MDDIFNQEFDGQLHPNHVTAENPMVFQQLTASNAAVIWEMFKGPGSWEIRKEEQDVPGADSRIGNQKTFNVVNYAKSQDISKNLFDKHHCRIKIGLNGETPIGTIPCQVLV